MDHVKDLEILSSQVKAIGVIIPEAVQIGAILAKLSSSWMGYRKKMLHSKEVSSYDDFTNSLHIECENRSRDVEVENLNFKVNHISLG